MKGAVHLVSLLLLFILLLGNTFIEPTMAARFGGYSSCGKRCSMRCARAGVKDRCLKYCGICCAKCKCVPSGTYGNKHQCPCYRDMRSSKGTPKCP